jgi:hypothetical protein
MLKTQKLSYFLVGRNVPKPHKNQYINKNMKPLILEYTEKSTSENFDF